MNITILVVFFILLFLCSSAKPSSPFDYGLTERGGGKTEDVGNAICYGTDGSIYVAGSYTGTATFGHIALTAAGSRDVFLVKYTNNTGLVLWAVSAGGSGSDSAYGISVADDGFVYVTGAYQTTAFFGHQNISSSGGDDIFIAKYDGQGGLHWVVSAGGTKKDEARSILVDEDSRFLYVTGYFFSSAIFGSKNVTSTGSYDIFIAKYETDTGQVEWVTQAGGKSPDYGYAIAKDPSEDSLYATGYFQGTASFGSTTLTAHGGNDIYVAKINVTSGLWDWAIGAGGKADDRGLGVALGPNSTVFVTGYFSDTAHFSSNLSVTTYPGYIGGSDLFVARYNAIDGQVQGVAQGGGPNHDQGRGIAVDAKGSIFVTGYFSLTAYFGQHKIVTRGSEDILVAKYEAINGDVEWVTGAGGYSTDMANSIALGRAGSLYTTGSFQGVAKFGDQKSLATAGDIDMFMASFELSCFGISPYNETFVCSGNGQCEEQDSCKCNIGFMGSTCNLFTCQGISSDNTSVCSGHGACIAPDECICHKEGGYVGTNCSIPVCFNKNQSDIDSCSSHGKCSLPDFCECFEGYAGYNCQHAICYGILSTNDSVCSNNGACLSPDFCNCTAEGYSGLRCDIPSCFGYNSTDYHSVCSGFGTCTSIDNCTCSSGYSGWNCQYAICNHTLSNDTSHVCSGRGKCLRPEQCQCDEGYHGQYCELKQEDKPRDRRKMVAAIVVPIVCSLLLLLLLVAAIMFFILCLKRTRTSSFSGNLHDSMELKELKRTRSGYGLQ